MPDSNLTPNRAAEQLLHGGRGPAEPPLRPPRPFRHGNVRGPERAHSPRRNGMQRQSPSSTTYCDSVDRPRAMNL